MICNKLQKWLEKNRKLKKFNVKTFYTFKVWSSSAQEYFKQKIKFTKKN